MNISLHTEYWIFRTTYGEVAGNIKVEISSTRILYITSLALLLGKNIVDHSFALYTCQAKVGRLVVSYLSLKPKLKLDITE